jgi:hypothetical protein
MGGDTSVAHVRFLWPHCNEPERNEEDKAGMMTDRRSELILKTCPDHCLGFALLLCYAGMIPQSSNYPE